MNRKEQDNYINVNLSRYTVKGIKDNPKVGGGVIGNGFDNLFSDYLNGLATKSPTHQNILSDLNRYITGMGLVSTNPADQAILDKFFSKRKLRKIVDSKLVQATLTLEVIRGKFEDEIKAVICHNPAQFRVNRLADGTPDGFLYRKSWDRGDRYNYKISAEFDRIDLKDKTQKSGLFYWYDNGSFPVYYGRPKYISGCDAIELEISAYTGVNHGVQNGMEASKIIELESSGDADADAKAIQDITNDLSGVANRGKVAIRMRPAGAEPMTITESGSNRLADTYNAIFELAESGILKCHGIPSSSLISGLTTKSTAFADPAVEMEWAKEELQSKIIEDERDEILDILDPIFKDLGIQGKVEFTDVIVNNEEESDQEESEEAASRFAEFGVGGVQGILSIQEAIASGTSSLEGGIATLKFVYGFSEEAAREMLGGASKPTAVDNILNPDTNNDLESEENQVNDNLKNLTGRQMQNVERIVRKFKKGQLTYSQAEMMLKNGYGMTAEDAKVWLVTEDTTALKKKMLENEALGKFIELGEEEDLGTYDIVQIDRMEGHEINIEPILNNSDAVKLARPVVSEREKESLQDTPLFKVRYFYQQANVSTGKSREFCDKMRSANRIYRLEDIIAAENESVNPGWGLRGANKYSIWLYKGGGGCKHWWERRIYLKRDNDRKISVNEARRIISDLPLDERDDNRLEQNDDRVATPTRFQPNGGFVTKKWNG